MRALVILFVVSLLNTMSYSQTAESIYDVRNIYDEKGDYYIDKNEFKKAIVYYNMAYKMDANNKYSILQKADAYTSLELYDQAAECYRVVFETELYIPNEYRLKFALLLLENKDIVGFENWLGRYNEIVNSEISGYLTANDVRAKMYKDSSIVIVENESILNTPGSETSPAINKNEVVFASNRKNLSGSAMNTYYTILSASYLSSGQLGKLNTFNTSINSDQNESSMFFSTPTNSLYFTRSRSVNSGFKTYSTKIPRDVNEDLYISEFKIQGIASIGHAAFNSDGTKVYFISEASGGIGGTDIYSSDFIGGKWSKPKNLGANINTSKDELYPFVLNDTTLYFTSAGHGGFGGLDLYSVSLNQENSKPKNLGNSVNSEYDDYSLSFSTRGYTGYFCSNRRGGFGKEDIYRMHMLNLKVKLAAYKFKKKSFIEEDKINLYLSNGDEYNIASEDNTGFNFTFRPEEAYKMIIQHENPLASNIIYNSKLSSDQKTKDFLSPKPFVKTDIKLQEGMKYQFTAGMKPISDEYKSALNEMSKGYQNSSGNTIDLTALAKELLLKEGEIYTIQFVKDNHYSSDNKAKEESSLSINNELISISGRSFFIVLPLDIEANFNIKTDIVDFKETYSPKKVGAIKVDANPVLKEKPVKESEGFPILVNTDSFTEVSKRKILAKELSIVPGTMYILTLGKASTLGKDKDSEVVIPLTKGVKYNLGSEAQSNAEYNKALAQMATGSTGNTPNEELIDISVLSKELDMFSDGDIAFSLMPAQKIASQNTGARNVLTALNVDGRKYFMTTRQKVEVKLKLDENKKVSIQTDLSYVKENFVASTIALKVDNTSFNKDLEEKKKSIITDPVFDVVVVNFDLNDYSIRPDAKSILAEKVIQVLKGDSRLYVTIKGYTDALGDAAYNEKLSRNRAITVKDFLNSNGIVESRIRTFSFGESLSLKAGINWEDLSEEELEKHRKVEIVIYLPK